MRFSRLLLLIVVGILFLIIKSTITFALVPNPGHAWVETECDSNLCVDTVNGKIGIGTATPNDKLEINGNLRFSSTATINAANSGALNIQSGTGSSYINILSKRNDAVTNVAFIIQTRNAADSADVSRLSIQGMTDTPAVTFENVGAVRFSGIGTEVTPNGDQAAVLGTTNNRWSALHVGTGSSDFAGNVGIGTTSPDNRMEIELDSATIANTVDIAKFTTTSSGIPAAGFGPSILFGAERSDAAETGIARIGAVWVTTPPSAGANEDSALVFQTVSAGSYNERMRINYDGNVGIGTTGPAQKLEVSGGNIAIRGGNQLILSNTVNNGNVVLTNVGGSGAGQLQINTQVITGAFTITNPGNVGIGTTNPTTMLHIYRNDATRPMLRVQQAAGSNGGLLSLMSNTAEWQMYVQGNDLLFTNPSTTRVAVLSSGNVGIGTASPAQKLEINSGALGFRDSTDTYRYTISPGVGTLRFASSGGTPVTYFDLEPAPQKVAMYVNNLDFRQASTIQTGASGDLTLATASGDIVMSPTGGNVGIGTATPASKLTVAGTIESTLGGVKFPDGSIQTVAAGASAIPSGAVMYFNLASCPGGWTELTAARGRYIVGLPLGGTLAGTAGSELSNLENRPTGAHYHYGSVMIVGGTGSVTTSSAISTGITGPFGGGAINTDGYTEVAGTNAPYIQLLVCQKT